MTKCRVTYLDSWKTEKSIILEGTYFEVLKLAKSLFGESNIIKVEDLEPKLVEENTSKFTEFPDYYDYGDFNNYDD